MNPFDSYMPNKVRRPEFERISNGESATMLAQERMPDVV